MAPVSTSAVLLRAHPYGETSRVLRFLTEDHGLLGVMAKGVRGEGGRGVTAVSTFASGVLTVYVKPQRELQTMKDFACTRLRGGLGASLLRFAGASTVAELVLAHAESDPNPTLFHAMEAALDRLEEASEAVAAAALAGVWGIVEALGFAPQLEACIRCGERLGEDEVGRFEAAAGGILCARCGEGSQSPRVGPIARSQLQALLEGRLDAPITFPRRHLALVSDFVAYHVASRPLRSLRFLGDVLPPDPEE
ncbi:MAG: DNA repair protein RecO [Gemmatimonadetes bacterium]|nr:DNA repair protein RecO [Gemmatimonadota bacterium]